MLLIKDDILLHLQAIYIMKNINYNYLFLKLIKEIKICISEEDYIILKLFRSNWNNLNI